MKRGGQVAVFLLAALVAIIALALMNVDIFLAVRSKNRLMNAGDAAALAAARVQGRLVNEIGRLNLAHVKALYEDNLRECAEIELAQRRLALLGPLDAVDESCEAAERNGARAQDGSADLLSRHAAHVRTVYAGGSGGFDDPYPESYPGAWAEYAAVLAGLAASHPGGFSAAPDNIEFHDAASPHILLAKSFYSAIAAEDWCWFFFRGEGLLRDFDSHRDFAPLAVAPKPQSCVNCEVYSLHLEARRTALADVFTGEELTALLRRAGVKPAPGDGGIFGNDGFARLAGTEQTWFFFDESAWRRWFDNRRLDETDPTGLQPGDFPIVGSIRDEYNVRGCSAVCRVSADSSTWCAAAKPFGSAEPLAERDGDGAPVTALKGFVVPCMQDVRLVAVDAAGGSNLATGDAEWISHVRGHLADYLANGPHMALATGCWYCRQLSVWERKSFHERGVAWLRKHSRECVRPVNGPYVGSGGTSHGH